MKYIFILFVFLTFSCSTATAPEQFTVKIGYNNTGVYLPINVNDTTLLFQWNTSVYPICITTEQQEALKLESLKTKRQLYEIKNNGLLLMNNMNSLSMSKRVLFDIGGSLFFEELLIVKSNNETYKNINSLGMEFLNNYSYLINYTDSTMSFSTSTIPVDNLNITDSLVIPYKIINENIVCQVTINNDSLKMIFDSTLPAYLTYNQVIVPWDIWLMDNDSTDIERSDNLSDSKSSSSSSQGMGLSYSDSNLVNNKDVALWSSTITDTNVVPEGVDGYISNGLMMKYNIFYIDKDTKQIRLYKLANQPAPLKQYTPDEINKRLYNPESNN